MDPFTGVRILSPTRSSLSMPPGRWIQRITASRTDIAVHEDISAADSPQLTIVIVARFDGLDYPVIGSPHVDSLAYTRIDDHTIAGIGKKHGAVCVTNTLTVSPDDGTLTAAYVLYADDREVARWLAVFESIGGGEA